MKIAVTAQGNELTSKLDPRFGRCTTLIIVNTDSGDLEAVDNAVNLNMASGAGIQTAEKVSDLQAEAVITGNVGPNAFKALNAAQIKVYLSEAETVKDAVDQFNDGKLKEVNSANVEGHW